MSNTEKDKTKASDHEIYGVTTIVSLLVPTVGIVLGIVYLSKEGKINHKLGEHLLAVGILSCLIAAIVGFTIFSIRPTPIETFISPYETSNMQTNQTNPTWDLGANYAKITKGMTKTSVELVIAKKPTQCTKSESSASTDKYASCTYGGQSSDGGIIVVNYVNDLVTTKEKASL